MEYCRACCSLGLTTLGRLALHQFAEQLSNGVRAVEQIRKMAGGSQSHLMRCSNDQYYVVKFQNNPQHRRILVNEFLGTALAQALGLPTAPFSIVHVSQELIDLTPELSIELSRATIPCQSGQQFGSMYVGNPKNTLETRPACWCCMPFDIQRQFAGMLVFDKWTCNTDRRQVLFHRTRMKGGRVVMIDQGFCFNEGQWNFPDSPLRGRYFDGTVYRQIRGIDDFEPWLGRLESGFELDFLSPIANRIPPEWYADDRDALAFLLERLVRRRLLVRDFLCAMRRENPSIFPRWRKLSRCLGTGVAPQFASANADACL